LTNASIDGRLSSKPGKRLALALSCLFDDRRASACGRSSSRCRPCSRSSPSRAPARRFPYTLTMLGFGAAGMVLGRWSDRAASASGLAASALLGVGYILSGYATTLFQFALAQGLLIGVGSSVTFGPLLAHVSMWFERRRGIAVAIVASGNYFAGPCGRRSSSTSSRPRAGARPISASAYSCSRRCFRSRC
jgi:hypothetical protein